MRGDQIFDSISIYNLPEKVTKDEIEELFETYGTIRRVVLKPDSGAAMAHVQYADERSAKLAVDSTEKYNFHGFNLFVIEKYYGPHFYESLDHDYQPRPPGSYIAKPRPLGSAHHHSGGFKVPDAPWGSYKVIVEGLPPSGSWQDVKDHFWRAKPLSSNVDQKGGAVLGFRCKLDAEKAVEMDGSKFTSRFKQETSIISVREASSSDLRDFQNRYNRSHHTFRKTILNEKASSISKTSESKNPESRRSESSSDDPIDFDEILGL